MALVSLLFRLLIIVLLTTTHAVANDSTAELAAGGIVLTHNDSIEMRSEDLFISQEEVRVRYKFFNTAPTNTKVLVAFPMPEVPRMTPVHVLSRQREVYWNDSPGARAGC